MKRLTVLAIIALSTATAACIAGKDGEPGPAGPPGTVAENPAPPAAPGASSGGTSGGASSSGGTSGGTPAPPAPTVTKTGTIALSQMSFTVADNEIVSYSAFASFIETTTTGTAPATGSKCTTTKEGDCDVTVCDIAATTGSGGTPPAPDAKKLPSAADITITGAEEVTLSADDKGLYTPKTGQTALFAAGEDIKVKAKGAEVPAFDKTVKAPAIINMTEPEWPAPGDAFPIDRTADLAFGWENGTAGEVQATISSLTDKKTATVMCKWKATAGKGTFPKAALAKLLVTEQGSVSISNTSTTAFDQGGWKINLTASSPATAPNGVASGIANIQ